MKKRGTGFFRTASYICMVFVIALGLMTIVGTGGGGGGGSDETTYQEPDPMAAPVTKQQDIDVSLPQSSSLNNETLKIMSFYGTSQVAPKAQRLYKTIPVTVTDTDNGDVKVMWFFTLVSKS